MKRNVTLKKSGTDLKRLDAMTDAEIDFSDIPEVTPAMFAKGIVRRGLKPITKRQLTLRLDSDVIEWFKEQGSGYQTKMNALLRAYVGQGLRDDLATLEDKPEIAKLIASLKKQGIKETTLAKAMTEAGVLAESTAVGK